MNFSNQVFLSFSGGKGGLDQNSERKKEIVCTCGAVGGGRGFFFKKKNHCVAYRLAGYIRLRLIDTAAIHCFKKRTLYIYIYINLTLLKGQ